MDGFQMTVLGIAVGLLIIILAVVGVVLASNSRNMLFPPSSLPCPNYWQMNSDGKCVIPVAPPAASSTSGVTSQYIDSHTAVNIGSSTISQSTTPGLDTTTNTINFAHNGWGTSTSSATCAKRKWAKEQGIFWDGISNYNGCKDS